jgi:hypothetical protein
MFTCIFASYTFSGRILFGGEPAAALLATLIALISGAVYLWFLNAMPLTWHCNKKSSLETYRYAS